MYVEIKNNELLSWTQNPYMDYQYVDIEYETFNPQDYKIEDGTLINITQSEEYIATQNEKLKQQRKIELTAEIELLDKKRVRAIAEPCLKNAESGETWLEFYNNQIRELRTQLEANEQV